MLVGRHIIKREAEKILNIRSAHVELKRNYKGDWNHITIIQTTPRFLKMSVNIFHPSAWRKIYLILTTNNNNHRNNSTTA
jgi:hypothetical protein